MVETHTYTLTLAHRWPHQCLQSPVFYSPGLRSTLTGVRIHFHCPPPPACIIFSSQAIVNNSGCFSLCWLAVNVLTNLCQSCHPQTLSCDAAKTAYRVHSWPWEFWKSSLMFNMQYLCVCVCVCVHMWLWIWLVYLISVLVAWRKFLCVRVCCLTGMFTQWGRTDLWPLHCVCMSFSWMRYTKWHRVCVTGLLVFTHTSLLCSGLVDTITALYSTTF